MQGSLGAIRHALEQVQTDEVRINILHEGTGDITDNDILLASASNAVVVGFNTKVDPQARRTAEAEGVEVRLYDIIYQLTDEMGAALRGLLEPDIIEVVEGRAEVRQIFRAGRNVIAGCYVTDGRIVRGGARVYRGGKLITTDRIESLRRFRDDVREVATGFECGIGLDSFNEVEEGDIIECFCRRRSLASPLPRGRYRDMSQRTARVDELLREEISDIVRREVDDPRIGFVTITDVEVTPGPAPRQRVGVGHRLGSGAQADFACAVARDAFRARPPGQAAHQTYPRPAHQGGRLGRARHARAGHP